MKTKSSRRLVRRLGLALAVAALLVPNAQAMPLDMKSSAADSARSRQYADDIRVGPPVRKYADDPAVSPVGGHDGYAPINELVQPVSSSSSGEASSTDWGNISVGIGSLLLVLGFGGLVFAVRHSRRGRLAAA